MEQNRDDQVERLLEESYVLIDPLPEQVPADGEGQYFAVERWMQEPSKKTELYGRFVRLVLKLNCYFDLAVRILPDETWEHNPKPDRFATEVTDCIEYPNRCIDVLFPTQDALLRLCADDVNMTLYHPSERLRAMAERLAAAEGLFVWEPPKQK